MANPRPRYTHDCEGCTFLGTVNGGGDWGRYLDLYYCTNGSRMCFLAVRSNRLGDYHSQSFAQGSTKISARAVPTVLAFTLAADRGLLPGGLKLEVESNG